MTLHFDCTACGRCCNALRLPLSIREAIQWLDHGGIVEFDVRRRASLPVSETDIAGLFRRERTFAANSGALPIRVRLNLVASFDGPCPNLRPNNLCGAYERRPATCRIYPAELRPDADIDPSARLCPPQAWSPDRPLLVRDARAIVNRGVADAVTLARAEGIADVAGKVQLAALLGINVAALANEGFTIWQVEGALLRSALQEIGAASVPADPRSPSWIIASPTPVIRAMIDEAGGAAATVADLRGASYLALQGSIHEPAV